MKNRQMNFSRWSFNNPLKVNSFGIPEPKNSKFVLPDVLLVPLVAFDKNKYRIGYGGGYYDKLLCMYPNTLKIGLTFNERILKDIPIENHDISMDYVFTNDNYYKSEI